jgi:hypothetical protein
MYDRFKALCPYLSIILVGMLFFYPILLKIGHTGMEDWDQHCFTDEVPRITVLEYGQFPLWNPYANGGRPMLANAQAIFLRPTFIFTLFFGCVAGLKIEITSLAIAGMIGMFLLSRYYNMTLFAGLLSASIFGLSSFFSLHTTVGHVIFFYYYLLPYVFLFFLKSFDKLKYIIISAVFLTFIVFGSTSHVLVPTCFFMAAYAMFLCVQKKKLKPLLHVFLLFMLAFGLGAVKLLPSIEFSNEHPRFIDSSEYTPLKGLYYIFLDRDQNIGLTERGFKGHAWMWHEYGAYAGIIPLVFFAIGLFLFWKTEFALLLSAVLALLLSLGNFAKWAPWNLLHQLPVFKLIRVPSRFIVFAVFIIAIIAGLAAGAVSKKRSNLRYVLGILLLFVIIDLILVNGLPFNHAMVKESVQIERKEYFIQGIDNDVYRSGATTSMLYNLLANNGTLNAYDPVSYRVFAKGIENPEYKGEVYVVGNGSAYYYYWSPNKLVVSVNVPNETALIVNQNYDKRWRVENKETMNFTGLLSAKVSPEDEKVTFYYLPATFLIGLAISIFSFIFAIILWRKLSF